MELGHLGGWMVGCSMPEKDGREGRREAGDAPIGMGGERAREVDES